MFSILNRIFCWLVLSARLVSTFAMTITDVCIYSYKLLQSLYKLNHTQEPSTALLDVYMNPVKHLIKSAIIQENQSFLSWHGADNF